MIKEIRIATGLSKRSAPVFQRAVALARKFKAHLTVLYVVDEDLPEKMVRGVQKEAELHIRYSFLISPTGIVLKSRSG